MNLKRLFLYVSLLLILIVGSTGCSSDEEEKDSKKAEEKAEDCYTACVTGALSDVETIQAIITYDPEDAHDRPIYRPQKYLYVYLLKSELGNPALQEGDVVDFKIISYEIHYPEEESPGGPGIDGPYFYCHVEPCN